MTGLLITYTLVLTPTVTPTLVPLTQLEKRIVENTKLIDMKMDQLCESEQLLFTFYCILYSNSEYEIDPVRARKVIAGHMHKWHVPNFDIMARKYERREDAKLKSTTTPAKTVDP